MSSNSEALAQALDAAFGLTLTKAQRREQRISFAYGNVHLHNPNITREMVAAECDKLDFPLTLHPDGTDTLFCKECESRVQDGEYGCHKGDACPYCVETALENPGA